MIPLIADAWVGPRWVAYAVFPQAERLAASELTRAGFTSYAPLIALRVQDPVVRSMYRKVLASRFIGYGFVMMGPTDPWRPVRDTAGIRTLLHGSDGRPSPIAVGEVERHQADDARLCDLAAETMTPMPRGARVRIDDGAFAGFAGVVVRCDGLVTTVTVEMFGRLIPVRMARASVAELLQEPHKTDAPSA